MQRRIWLTCALLTGLLVLPSAVLGAPPRQGQPIKLAKRGKPIRAAKPTGTKTDPKTLIAEALAGPMKDVREIVFAQRQTGPDGHWYANFAYYAPDTDRKAYRAMGRLCKLDVRTGEITVLLDDPSGTVRDPKVHYDGKTILFAYRKGGTDHFHLYEIQSDGSGLRQITDGPYDDIEPTYLPDDDIVFVSSRCNRWVNCWLTQVAVMYRCDRRGGRMRAISGNIEHDNTPWVLPDGRVLYQRWEYIDRSQVHYHHLWTANPDGTGQMTYYGNMQAGTVMIDAKPIPGSQNVLAVFSPGHGRREHAGAITIIQPQTGPDDRASAIRVHPSEHVRDPYPISDDCYLVAVNDAIQIMNRRGETATLYALPKPLAKKGVLVHEPRPLVPRQRERVIPSRVDLSKDTGTLVLTDVYRGRRMEGVEPGEITHLLVLETLPKPINFTGGMEPLSYGGTFTLERILGTVPVEPDGSAHFEVPAMRSVFFVALDERGYSVKRMQSFLTVMPGETTSCVGCHENRTKTPATGDVPALSATMRPPSKIEPIKDVPDVFDFPRDIQPILDRHCVGCHDPDRREGGVLMTGDRGPMFSHSYYTLSIRKQFADGRNLPKSNYPPRALGSSASPLMKKIDGGHHDVKASDRDRKMVRLYLETGAPYPGTYAALGTGMIGGYAQNRIDRSDTRWPSVKKARDVIKRRCASCHTGDRKLPDSPTDNLGTRPWKIPYGSPKLRFSRHIIYNLSRPEKSVQLLAPLAKEAGGYGLCKPGGTKPGKGPVKQQLRAAKRPRPAAPGKAGRSGQRAAGGAVFASPNDPDYQTLLAAILDVKEHLEEIGRFDMPTFQPRDAYLREMVRYGVLDKPPAAGADVDAYQLDRAYWQSLWWRPVGNGVEVP